MTEEWRWPQNLEKERKWILFQSLWKECSSDLFWTLTSRTVFFPTTEGVVIYYSSNRKLMQRVYKLICSPILQ